MSGGLGCVIVRGVEAIKQRGVQALEQTQRYADYAPNEREVEMVDRAFGGPGL